MQQLSKELAEEFYGEFFYGTHHIPNEMKPFGYGWSVACTKPLASTDYNDLTRLVLMAHDRCIRVEIVPKGMNRYLLVLSPRERDGKLMTGHPTIEQAIEKYELHKTKKAL